ncbi:SDR family NAD(P)-dependent oxidoreductase [Bordetella sp. N]|uniref:SDR family NAD(P)-dependent oxidoreductase n=1 Tax=Bordetella sp. N TaxID=1746199 RepID=UPI00070CA925|nr:SDR family oxidoreductase [Bordetella sp. N]ALM85676.1 oxidoreductase [Bordetella sp. N]
MALALVTGAASGIGAAIAAALRAAGWEVVGLDRSPAPARDGAPDGTAGAVYSHHIQVDLTDDDALRTVLRDVGPVSAVVHAAGFMRTAPLGHLNPADGEAMWRIHVRAAEVLVDALAPTLPEGARIVLVGSRTANGAAGRSQYAATKAALIGMARSWAAELAPRGITVNVIAPGATDTPMLRDPARGGTPPRLPPMGRYVHPDEIGAVAAFLLGPGAGAITGQQIIVCGGASLA